MSSPSLRQPITRSLTRRISTSSPLRNIDKRASSQLFEDAAKEEAETAEHPPKGPQVQEYRNWTGDEEIQDTVLRMLVDKYKPLRTGTIRTAEEKLSASTKPSPETRAEVLTAAYFDDSKPWNIGFRTPSHTPPIPVQAGHTLPPPRSYESLKDLENQSPEDIRLRAERKLARKLAAGPQRLGKAKESILDYKSGKDATQTDSQRMPNPVSLKGWTSLVDHRIEQARATGFFNSVKGRGKPLQRHPDESNPFISREEFLLNRILQKNKTAPPWVEYQQELDLAMQQFRFILQEAWIRRCVRRITFEVYPPSFRITLDHVDRMSPDEEWESRELGYHEESIKQLNSTVRKYNGAAPYAVRRPYFSRSAELDRCYERSAEVVLDLILKGKEANLGMGGSLGYGEERGGSGADAEVQRAETNVWDVWKTWVRKVFGYTNRAVSPP